MHHHHNIIAFTPKTETYNELSCSSTMALPAITMLPFAKIEQNVDKENFQRSRKRRASEGSILKPKPVVAVAHTSNNDNDSGGSHWKQLFMSLQQERVTAIESQLISFMEDSEKREDALKNYIRHLESDLKHANMSLEVSQSQTTDLVELQEKLNGADDRMETMSAEVDQLKDDIEAKDAVCRLLGSKLMDREDEIEMYKLLTHTDVSRGEQDSIECCVMNPIKEISTKFRLSKVEDEKMMKYEPVENPEILPAFLHEAIEFETADCPSLIQNILKGVFPDEE